MDFLKVTWKIWNCKLIDCRSLSHILSHVLNNILVHIELKSFILVFILFWYCRMKHEWQFEEWDQTMVCCCCVVKKQITVVLANLINWNHDWYPANSSHIIVMCHPAVAVQAVTILNHFVIYKCGQLVGISHYQLVINDPCCHTPFPDRFLQLDCKDPFYYYFQA